LYGKSILGVIPLPSEGRKGFYAHRQIIMIRKLDGREPLYGGRKGEGI